MGASPCYYFNLLLFQISKEFYEIHYQINNEMHESATDSANHY